MAKFDAQICKKCPISTQCDFVLTNWPMLIWFICAALLQHKILDESLVFFLKNEDEMLYASQGKNAPFWNNEYFSINLAFFDLKLRKTMKSCKILIIDTDPNNSWLWTLIQTNMHYNGHTVNKNFTFFFNFILFFPKFFSNISLNLLKCRNKHEKKLC